MNISISLIIFCLNEEHGLRWTYEHYKKIFVELNIDYEVIISNDGSTDQTARIAEEIKSNDQSVILLTNDSPKGIGYNYKVGLKKVSKEFYMFAGANCAPEENDLVNLVNSARENDIVLAYVINNASRGPLRLFFSRVFTFLMGMITGRGLRYYNAMVICKTSLLRCVTIRSDGYTFSAECTAKLLKEFDCSYCEVPITVEFGKKIFTKNFHIKTNLLRGFKFFAFLIYDLYIARKKSPTYFRKRSIK